MFSRKASKQQQQRNEVRVWSFFITQTVGTTAVHVKHYQEKILVKDLLTAVVKTLGIQKENEKLFAIFEGPLQNPFRKLEGNYELNLPYEKALSIQKWSFDVGIERRAVKSDMVVSKLLRLQAMSDIETGRLNPTQDDMEKLDDYANEKFRVDHQFMSIIHSLKDYGAVMIENCEVITELTLPRLTLTKKEYITLQIDLKGLTIKTGNTVCAIPWSRILQVTKEPSGNTVEYEIYVQSQVVKWLRLQTCQARYLMAGTSEIWQTIKERNKTRKISNNGKCTVSYHHHLVNFDEI